ncbi:hypothetical protein HID58_055756 [Brassica napus]|uniref:Uncharacterized protein n=1 Tax=Brassica napus TaxID=3708 RepID=A0ABQ8AL96_BRANA|nr:hypothetical protein HID58_055756 [Brassica napus]
MRRCPHCGDWSELAESLMEKPGTQDFSLHFWRLSGSMNRVGEYMALLAPLELVKAVMDFHSAVASYLVSGLYFDFWQGGVQHVHLGTWRLDGLSSCNPEAGWTLVLEPGGWMDSRPGTRRL